MYTKIPPWLCFAMLCGGSSRRMGCDKSTLTIDGTTLIERAVGNIQTSVGAQNNLFVCSNGRQYDQLSDRRPIYLRDYLPDNQGPLSALAAVLIQLRESQCTDIKWILTFPSDTLLLPCEVFDLLRQSMIDKPDSQLIYLYDGRDHPLHGVYSVDVIDRLLPYLQQGNRSVMGFVERLRYQRVEVPQSCSYLNFNTESEFNQALQAYKQYSGS